MTAAITATLYDADGGGAGTVLENASGKSFLVESNATGSGTMRLPITDDDAALLDYDKVVVFSYADQDPKAWFIESLDWNVVDEEGNRYAVATGRGLEGWLEGAAVYPFGGIKRNSALERHFTFASLDSFDHDMGVTWDRPGAITWDDRVGPLAGYPLDWPDIQARWIWAGDPYDLVPAETPNWFRRRFTLTARYPVRVFATADNGADVYIDGEQVLSFPHGETGNWKRTFTADLVLEPGTHVIAAEARNAIIPTTPTPAGFLAMITTLTPDGEPDATILRSSTVFACATDEPGWLAGDVLHTLVLEAQARGAGRLANLTMDFDAALDSNGDPWTIKVKRSWRVGFDSVLTVAGDLAELGVNFWITPDLVLHAAETRGQITDVTLHRGQDDGAPSVQAWSVAGQRPTATHALILTGKGWVQRVDSAGLAAHGRLEVGLELGNTDSDDTADEVAAIAFNAAAAPQETVKATSLIPAADAIAFVDFGIGDVVNGWDKDGEPAQVRVLSISVTEDDADGKVTYGPEFDVYDPDRARPFPPRTPGQTLAVAVRKAFPGAAGGKIRSVAPGTSSKTPATAGTATSAGGGGPVGSAALLSWADDAFDVTPTDLGPFGLSYRPLLLSEDVKVNGVGVDRSTWTRDDTTLSVDPAVFDGIDADGPWLLTVHYQHSGITGSPTDAPDTGVGDAVPVDWQLNGDAYLDGTTVVLDPDTPAGSEKGTMVSVATVPAGWSIISVALTADLQVDGSSGNGIAFGLLDSSEDETYIGPGAGAGLGIGQGDDPGGVPIDTVACALGWIDTESYYSGDGTGAYLGSRNLSGTTTTDSDSGLFADDGINDYEVIFTATTPGRASAVLKWNGTTILTSTTDLYVPTTPRIIIGAASGANHQYAKVTAAVVSTGGVAIPDPSTYEPGGTDTPPDTPPTPGTPDLSWAPPASSGWTEREIPSGGGTLNLAQDEDWYLAAPDVVTAPVTIVGGGNIKLIGLIGEQSNTVPTGDYDAERRGLRFKDGPNPNIARRIHCEGVWFRDGYYSDPIQLAFQRENAVTFVLENYRVADDAIVYGGNTGGLIHADLIQFYGGPRTFLSDGVTGKGLTYQGAYLDAGDDRALPAGAGVPWQIRRWNLEEDTMNGGAHYLLADRQPAFTQLVCDEVYVLGGKNVNDSFGRFPTAGVHRDATPPGGDFVPASLWTGDTYTSPGYV
ncbi:MAG: hypothetical protein AB7I38_14475 [Dehalococcoidia bacterium]